MEGAAYMYACKMLELNGFQIRAVSNYIEDRNRANWEIEKALENLEKTTIKIIKNLDLTKI